MQIAWDQSRASKDLQKMKQQLGHERALKLEAFHHADDLMTQVWSAAIRCVFLSCPFCHVPCLVCCTAIAHLPNIITAMLYLCTMPALCHTHAYTVLAISTHIYTYPYLNYTFVISKTTHLISTYTYIHTLTPHTPTPHYAGSQL